MVSIVNVFLVFITILGIFAENDPTISVRIKNGLIEGKRETFDGKNLNVFRGIPYAEPPIGQLRFKKPVPKNKWSDTLNGKEWPNSCWHIQWHSDYFNANMSEDCLYLNIWSPIEDNPNAAPKAVFFWIHGGGLVSGSSAEKFYSGHVLAAKGDIVVVTINYRLSVFGFLYTGTDDTPGNMGLWDQALALEWVNDNIQYFGGDPTRITIAGESAGAVSVSLLILSPTTRHLFKNAIVMSGAAIADTSLCDKESLILYYKEFLQTIDCSGDSQLNSDPFSVKQFECINNKSGHQINKGKYKPGQSLILKDGQFLMDFPSQMFKNKDFKKNFNLFIGSTEDEGSLFLPFGMIGNTPFDKHDPPQIDYSTAIEILKKGSKYLIPELDRDAIEKVTKLYLRGLSNNTSSNKLLKAIGIGLGDFTTGCPTILFGKKLYELEPKINVYQYYFNSKDGDEGFLCAKWMGVCHFDDIYPVFGIPFTDIDKYTQKEREVSQEMIEYFSSFVRTGRPSRDGSPEWHHFYKIDDKIIAPFKEITDKERTDTTFGVGLKITECEYLWKKYISPDL